MSRHQDFQDMLSLAAAGALGSEDERELRAHLAACAVCSSELSSLEELAAGLRRLPTPQPAANLIARVRRQVELELAARTDERLNQLVLLFLLVVSWTVTWAGFVIVRLLSGETLSVWSSLSSTGLTWSIVYFVTAWLGGTGAVVLLGLHARKTRRLA